MRVGVIQSAYIPWRGYFDLIDSVDLFVVYDDVQYSTGSWRNRNRVKTRSGLKWISVPVRRKLGLAIDEVLIAAVGKPWREYHRRLLTESLGDARCFRDALELWEAGTSWGEQTLSRLNVRLMRLVCEYLSIRTPVVMSRDYQVTERKTERLINLLKGAGATVYLSGPTAQGYLDESQFRARGIRLEYKSYDYEPYPQQWGEFVGTVSVLDLIANTGSEARRFLKSRTPDRVAVE